MNRGTPDYGLLLMAIAPSHDILLPLLLMARVQLLLFHSQRYVMRGGLAGSRFNTGCQCLNGHSGLLAETYI